MHKSWLLAALLSLTSLAPTAAQHVVHHLFVGPANSETASDSNDCLTAATACATGQGAVDKVPLGDTGDITLLPGVHTIDGTAARPAINVYYWRGVNIHGDCQNPASTTVHITTAGITAIVGQDYPILVVGCLQITTAVNSNVAIHCRQLAICDYGQVRFGSFPNGQHVTVADGARASCTGQVWIDGAAVVHASAGNNSLLHLDCPMTLAASFTFAVFAQAANLSTVTATGATFNGPGATTSLGIRCTAQYLATFFVGSVTPPGHVPCQAYDGAIIR